MERLRGILGIDPGALAGMLLSAAHPCICGWRTVVVGHESTAFYWKRRCAYHGRVTKAVANFLLVREHNLSPRVCARGGVAARRTVVAMSGAITGLDIQVASVCGHKRDTLQHWCDCSTVRVAPYSKRSAILIWRCVACGTRRGRVDEESAAILRRFVERHACSVRPLRIIEGVAHV
jgi:hypothetical protein